MLNADQIVFNYSVFVSICVLVWAIVLIKKFNDVPLIKDKFSELSSSEKPILETLLVNDKNNSLKLLSKLKKIKKIKSNVKK